MKIDERQRVLDSLKRVVTVSHSMKILVLQMVLSAEDAATLNIAIVGAGSEAERAIAKSFERINAHLAPYYEIGLSR